MHQEAKVVPTDILFQETLRAPAIFTVLDDVYLQGVGGTFRVGRFTAAGIELLSIRYPYDVKGRERTVTDLLALYCPMVPKFYDERWHHVTRALKYAEADAFQRNLRTKPSKHYTRNH